jgi:hypothetical protein
MVNLSSEPIGCPTLQEAVVFLSKKKNKIKK